MDGTMLRRRADQDEMAEAAAAAACFEAAMAQGDREAAQALTAPIFHLKRRRGDDSIEALTIDALEPRPPTPRPLSALELCFGQLAVARLDDWRAATASLLVLFKHRALGWRIAAEAAATDVTHPARFDPAAPASDVLHVLDVYYRAVREGLPQAIAEIFDERWHMKNHENGEIVCEDKAAFIKRIEEGPLPTYSDNRLITDVRFVGDRLAFVRVDRPSTPSTTAFLFMRRNAGWFMTDKVWADGRLE